MSPPRGVGILAMVCRLVGGDLSCRWARRGVYIFESEDRYARGGGFELSVELSRGVIIVRWRVCTKNDTHFLEQAIGKRITPPSRSQTYLAFYIILCMTFLCIQFSSVQQGMGQSSSLKPEWLRRRPRGPVCPKEPAQGTVRAISMYLLIYALPTLSTPRPPWERHHQGHLPLVRAY